MPYALGKFVFGLVAGGEPPEPVRPGQINDLSVLSTTTSTIALAFTDAARATSHEYQLDGGGWVPLDPSKVIDSLPPDTSFDVQVRGVNAEGNGPPSNTVQAQTQPVPIPVPVNTAVPTISGIAQVGEELTASTGTWTNNPIGYAYQWQRNAGSWADIPGATANTYLLVEDDEGATIRVQVIASNTGGPSAPANSAATGTVQPEPAPTWQSFSLASGSNAFGWGYAIEPIVSAPFGAIDRQPYTGSTLLGFWEAPDDSRTIVAFAGDVVDELDGFTFEIDGVPLAVLTPASYNSGPDTTIMYLESHWMVDDQEYVIERVEALPAVPSITPAAAWDGTAGSGYEGNPPIQTGTAIPGRPEFGWMHGTVAANMHWLAPYATDDRFNEDITVIVSAMRATDGGVEFPPVTFHCEGNTVVVSEPTVHEFPRGDETVYLTGYAVRIPRDQVVDGAIDLYASTDAATGMAARVIGPMRVYLKAAPDIVLQVGPSLTDQAGVRYNTVPKALNYLAAQPSLIHAEINIVEDFTWNVTSTGLTNNNSTAGRRGNVVLSTNGHAVNVTATNYQYFRPLFNGLVWRGFGFDMEKIAQIYSEQGNTGAGFRLQRFEGCAFSQSDLFGIPFGAGRVDPGATKNDQAWSRVEGAFVNCEFTNVMMNTSTSPAVFMFNRSADCAGDSLFAACQIGADTNTSYGALYAGNKIVRQGSFGARQRIPVMQLAYSGAGAATWNISGTYEGGSPAAWRTLNLKVDGSIVLSLKGSKVLAANSADPNVGVYWVADAVALINAFGNGWSATVVDNRWRMSLLGGEENLFASDQPVANAVPAALSLHVDGFQTRTQSDHDNFLVLANEWFECEGQILFPSIQATARSTYNGAIVQNAGSLSQSASPLENISQMQGAHHHLLMVGNSLPNQTMSIRRDEYTPNFTTACRFQDNLFLGFTQAGSGGTLDATVSGNHGYQSFTVTGSSVSDNTTGGAFGDDYPDLYDQADAVAQFNPAVGATIRGNLAARQLPKDIVGKDRLESDIVGVFSRE